MKLNINGKVIEVSNEDLSKALEEKKDSIDLKSDDFIVRTKDEDDLFAKNKEKEGLSIGAEIGRKELIKGLGIESDGAHKSDKTAIEAIKNIISGNVTKALTDAKIEPNKKIEELKADMELLRSNLTKSQDELKNKSSEFQSFKQGLEVDNELISLMPDNTLLPKKEMLILFKSKQKVEKLESGQTVGLGIDGQPLKNTTTLQALPLKEVVTNFFSENSQYLKGAEGGAGGSDSSGGNSKKSWEQFEKEQSEKGHQLNGEEYIKDMQDEIKAGRLEA